MRSSCRLAAALFLFVLASATAAQDGRVDVTVSHNGTDGVGRRLAASLRNELQLDKRIRVVAVSDERIGVYLVTMGRGDDGTIYSATWPLGGMVDDGYLTSKVGTCDSDRVRSCVRSLAAETHKHASVLYSIRNQQPAPR
jgi:hypothetical protein